MFTLPGISLHYCDTEKSDYFRKSDLFKSDLSHFGCIHIHIAIEKYPKINPKF